METIWEDRNGNGQVYHIGGIGMQEGYKSGPVPTQEMVDAYPTNEGDWILDLSRPYLNVEHTQPNLNPNAKDSKNEAYSESDPYSCFRDPRFYASIYYHGSKRYTRWSFAEGEYAVNTFRAREIDCAKPIRGPAPTSRRPRRTSGSSTRTGYYSRKYLNPTKNPTSPRNDAPGFKHFRFAEIILNYAEAAAEAGHTSDALEALKEIRDRVAMPHITTTDQAALIREIRAERRIELFFEEHRFFDIRRWQQPDGNLEDICTIPRPCRSTSSRTALTPTSGSRYATTGTLATRTSSCSCRFRCRRLPLGVDYRHELAESRMVAANFFNGFKTDKRDDT